MDKLTTLSLRESLQHAGWQALWSAERQSQVEVIVYDKSCGPSTAELVSVDAEAGGVWLRCAPILADQDVLRFFPFSSSRLGVRLRKNQSDE